MEKTIKQLIEIAEFVPGYTTIYEVDEGLNRLYYSKQVPSLLGYTQEEFYEIGKREPIDFMLPSDRNVVINKMLDGFAAKQDVDISYRLVHKENKLVWVRAHAKYIGEHDGKPIFFTSIFDVTDEWERKDALLETSDRAVAVFDKETKEVLYGNSAFFEYAQTTAAECIGKPCFEMVCKVGEWKEKDCFCFHALNHEGGMEIQNPTTKTCFHLIARETMWGEHEAIVFYMTDITENKKKDMRLAEKNHQIQKIQDEAIKSYKWQLDSVLQMNTNSLSIFEMNLTKNTCGNGNSAYPNLSRLGATGTVDGYFEEAIFHIPKIELARMKNLPSRKRLLKAFSQSQREVSIDCHYEVATGDERFIRTTINMMENPVNHEVQAVIYTQDITRQNLYDNIMKQLMEKQYEGITVLNTVSNQIVMLQYGYNSEYSEPLKLVDYDEAVDAFARKYVVEQEQEVYRQGIAVDRITQMLDQHNNYSFQFHFKNEDGSVRLKTISFYYLDEHHKQVLNLIEDITEMTRTQEEYIHRLKDALLAADQATEARTTFFSNVSHDMRTPLNGILGFANLAEDADSLEEVKDCIEKIKTSGEFMLQLVNDTLDMSKIDSNCLTLNPQLVNAQEIVDGVVNAVSQSALKKNIKLNIVVSDEIKNNRVRVDKLRLQQIFVNLIGNSIKFTQEGGQVDFETVYLKEEENGANIKVTIRDNGIGMKKEFVGHAFEAYSQQKSVLTVQEMGTGLGLSIVKQIVEMMNGTIILQSEEGKGTQFDVYFPIEIVKGVGQIENMEQVNADLSGKHILLCEDHPINRELAVRLLKSKGIETTSAENGKLGVELFEKSEEGYFDAILMDVRMPEMDGLEATRTIRQFKRMDATTVPIIAMTANAFSSDKLETIHAGMNAHISKPVEPKILFDTLAKYMKQ